MPAAAVIPALRACSHIAAVKTPVVYVHFRKGGTRPARGVHCEQIRTLRVSSKNDSAQYEDFSCRPQLWKQQRKARKSKESHRGCKYFMASGKMHLPMRD